MIVAAINHHVADYEAWKAVFDEFPPSRGGALFHRINRGVDDANNITSSPASSRPRPPAPSSRTPT